MYVCVNILEKMLRGQGATPGNSGWPGWLNIRVWCC